MVEDWIQLSINRYFHDNRGTFDLYIYGQDESILNGFMRSSNSWAELKISGPNKSTPTAVEDIRELWIHVMCCTKPSNDLALPAKILNKFLSLFLTTIPIYKLGTDPEDDGTQLGCLQLITQPIDVINWGKLNPSDSVSYQAIEGQYKLVA